MPKLRQTPQDKHFNECMTHLAQNTKVLVPIYGGKAKFSALLGMTGKTLNKKLLAPELFTVQEVAMIAKLGKVMYVDLYTRPPLYGIES